MAAAGNGAAAVSTAAGTATGKDGPPSKGPLADALAKVKNTKTMSDAYEGEAPDPDVAAAAKDLDAPQKPDKKPARPPVDRRNTKPDFAREDEADDGEEEAAAPKRPEPRKRPEASATEEAESDTDEAETDAPEPESDAPDEPADDVDDSDVAEPEEKPKPDPALQSFAKRFKLPLDSATQARDTLLDDLQRKLGIGEPGSPAPGSKGQPPQASAQHKQPPSPTQAQDLPEAFTDDEIKDFSDAFGDKYVPILTKMNALVARAARIEPIENYIRTSESRRVTGTINSFFGDKIRNDRAGVFRNWIGTEGKGLDVKQTALRRTIVDIASRIQEVEQVDDAEALELGFQLVFRDQLKEQQSSESRQNVVQSLEKRQRQQSLVPSMGSKRKPGGKGELMGVIQNFRQGLKR
jgi:hypothetical protein